MRRNLRKAGYGKEEPIAEQKAGIIQKDRQGLDKIYRKEYNISIS